MSGVPDNSDDGKVTGLARTRKLRRHTIRTTAIVWGFRIALPIVAVLILLGLVLYPFVRGGTIKSMVGSAIPNLVVENLNYKGVSSEGYPYSVLALRATRPDITKNLYDFDSLKAEMTMSNGAWISGKADYGRLDQDTHKLWIGGNVQFFHDKGYQVTTDALTADLQMNTAQGDKPIIIQGSMGQIYGKGFRLMDAGQVMIILGAAKANLYLSSGDVRKGKIVTVTADKSLEWYQGKNLYVARGNARAVQDKVMLDADILVAHTGMIAQKKPTLNAPESRNNKVPDAPVFLALDIPNPFDKSANKKPMSKVKNQGHGDIDLMMASGHVRAKIGTARAWGERGFYDAARQVWMMTGQGLRYESGGEVVTALDSLEYWEDKKIAVARGKATYATDGRHIEGDILMAEFESGAKGSDDLKRITAYNHVVVMTADGDVARGDLAIYDAMRDVAVLRGHVKITRQDGTQLSGEVGETDFKSNRSRLVNNPTSRVHALVPLRPTKTLPPLQSPQPNEK